MEIKIWEKDDFFQFTNAGRIEMDAEAVTLTDRDLPVYWEYDRAGEFHGRARNARVVDGEIVVDVEFFKEGFAEHVDVLLKDKLIRFAGGYKDVIQEVDADGNKRVTHCVLNEVSVVRLSRMPKKP